MVATHQGYSLSRRRFVQGAGVAGLGLLARCRRSTRALGLSARGPANEADPPRLQAYRGAAPANLQRDPLRRLMLGGRIRNDDAPLHPRV
jgi:hypothetical protein